MGTGPGAGPDRLTHLERLTRTPETHHIFHALRVLEAAFAEAPRLGEARRPSEDRLRIGQAAEMAFPTSAIAALIPPAPAPAPEPAAGDVAGDADAATAPEVLPEAPEAPDDAPPAAQPAGTWRLSNRVFGLFGPQGPLPLHLTEYARDRWRNHRDGAFIAFADMLTHRLASLFYRAWASALPAPSFDRAAGAGRGPATRDPFAMRVAAVAGVMGPAFAGRDALPDLARLHFAGHFGQGARHGEGLMAIVAAFVRAPVRLQEFVGSWLDLDPGDTWRLGAPAGLGRGSVLGGRVWSRSAKFRLRIGPLGLADFRRLLPGSPSLTRLDAAVRAYVGDTLDYDVNLVLAAAEVPRARLGAGGDTRLGLTSWLGPRGAFADDAEELYLSPQRLRAASTHTTGTGIPR